MPPMFLPALLLITVLLAVGVFVMLTMALLMAQSLLRPPRMTDGKAVYVLQRLSPGDLGLPFQAVTFMVPDESTAKRRSIDIAAWWIPHPAKGGKCVVLIHGYADAKVGAIAWAPQWHALGYHILAIDLRAHGESGGCDCTAGFFERHDLTAVLNRLRAERPEAARDVVLFGVSLGSAVALATAVDRDDLAAIVLESPFGDYRNAVRSHVEWLGLPGGLTLKLALGMAKRISGADFDTVRPIELLPRVRCPMLLIRGADDRLIPADDLAALERVAKQKGCEIWTVPGAGHLEAVRADPEGYGRQLRSFLDKCGLNDDDP